MALGRLASHQRKAHSLQSTLVYQTSTHSKHIHSLIHQYSTNKSTLSNIHQHACYSLHHSPGHRCHRCPCRFVLKILTTEAPLTYSVQKRTDVAVAADVLGAPVSADVGLDKRVDVDVAADVLGAPVSVDVGVSLDKRQLSLDLGGLLGGVTGTVEGLLSVVTGLLTTVTGTVGNADEIVNAILAGTVNDVDAALADVTAKVQSVLTLVDSVLATVNVGNTLSTVTTGVSAEITSTVTTVEGLLVDVQALVGVVDAGAALGTVTGLVNQLVAALEPLTGSISI